MTDERQAAIEHTIATLETQGIAWTNQMIYDAVGGQYGDLAVFLKARRAGASGTSASTSEIPASTSEIPASTSETPAAVAVLEPPAAVGEPVPPPPKPPFTEARERAQACARSAAQAVQSAQVMADKISQLQTRVQERTAVRAKGMESVEALRALKAEIEALEEQIEVWTSQHTTLAHTAQTQREVAARARQSYEQLRLQAIMTLQNARPTANEAYLAPELVRLVADDRARSVRELTALIGAEAVDTYLTSVSRGDSSSRVPPWVYRSEIP